ncbi:MAG: aldo/keto reductase [Abitibacteriaceae bacterium]|nr:aldo/keto reductase [Abditibacteriaceae bacterium]
MEMQQPQEERRAIRTLNRREFVQVLGAATVRGGLIAAAFKGFHLTPAQKVEAAEAINDQLGKLPRRQLGTRMGKMEITPIVISQDWSRDLYGPALDLGINFVHKAGYWRSMPEEFKKLPRESYYTDITVDSTPNNPDDEEKAYNQVTESLKNNGLGYYDIFRAHFGWKSVEAMKQKRGTHRAFDRLKKEGKVKYFGVSQHDFVPYPEIIGAIIDEGLIDSIQLFYSYKADPQLNEIYEKAHKAGIGMTAMKVCARNYGKMNGDTARQEELKASGKVGRALFRHVLTQQGADGHRIFDACVARLGNFEMFEENVGAAASKAAAADGFKLA